MDRFDQLVPRDVAITLRSIRRRLAGAVAGLDGEDLADVIDRPGPTGAPLDDVVAGGARAAGFVRNELDRSLDHDDPTVAAEVFDPDGREFPVEATWDRTAAVEAVGDETDAAADRLERASSGELGRQVRMTGEGLTTPIAIARQLARETIALLDTVERHVEWLRDQA